MASNPGDVCFRPDSKPLKRMSRRASGFTLIEALVSLIIFGIIMTALSFALSAALKAQSISQSHERDAGAVRGIFDPISKDIQAAYLSSNDPNNVFIAGGSTASGSSLASAAASSLLTLAATNARILSTDPNVDPTQANQNSNAAGTASGGTAPPQSPVALVRYDLDSTTGTLRRTVTNIPNLQNFQQITPSGAATVVARNIVSLTLQFWDPSQSTWRTDWDYEQQTQASQAASSTGSTSTATGASATSSSSASSTNGDTYLPQAVQIVAVLRRSNGSQATYTVEIPVVAPQIPATIMNPNLQTTTGTGTSTGTQ